MRLEKLAMTGRPQRHKTKALFGAAALCLLSTLLAPACTKSSGESHVSPCESLLKCGASCATQGTCSGGQYCSSSKVCTADCVPNDANCGTGQICNSFGQCIAAGIDPGVDPGAGDGGPN